MTSHELVELTGGKPVGRGEIVAVATCRNERLRLPAFLRHYRALGVEAFFVTDNDSSDGSREYLLEQPDVRVFHTSESYRAAGCGTRWLNRLLSTFGVGRWCVTADIDELLIYPGSETTTLRQLTAYFDRHGCEALRCLLLDLYPDGPLARCTYASDANPISAAPLFDRGPYSRARVNRCPWVLIRGGMRERVFYPEFRTRGAGRRLADAVLESVGHRVPGLRDRPAVRERVRRNPPCLTKAPLVKWDERTEYFPHWISSRRVAPETGALLHFKYFQDFHERALQEVARGDRCEDLWEYQRYAEYLRRDPQLTLADEHASVRFEGTSQLVELGLIDDSEAWRTDRAARRA